MSLFHLGWQRHDAHTFTPSVRQVQFRDGAAKLYVNSIQYGLITDPYEVRRLWDLLDALATRPLAPALGYARLVRTIRVSPDVGDGPALVAA